MKKKRSLMYGAWKKMIAAYLLSFTVSLVIGTCLITVAHLKPDSLFMASTKRLSYALPILEMGTRFGIDLGILLFFWNTIGALLTISFIYTTAWFNPHFKGRFPSVLRSIFCGTTRMKLLCYLPGCKKIEEEPIRRVYVWVMVPLLSMILLGIESGMTVSTGAYLFGSFSSSFMALVPHGLVEIPTLALAGAVPFSAHLLIKEISLNNGVPFVFQQVEKHRNTLPIKKVAGFAIGGLFAAGLVEAHLTQWIMNSLLS